MNYNLLLALVGLTLGLVPCITSEDSSVPIVKVPQGLIQGGKETTSNGKAIFSYRSIPYAQPPKGSLRFKSPAPSTSWEKAIDGTKIPKACAQLSPYFDLYKEDISDVTVSGDEDCLYLNVFTNKPNDGSANLPVMIYIHGGAFIIGDAELATPYILLNEDIVLVVLQYRLGVFGFLSTEDDVMPGNMGLKDQQLALKWVKDNIIHFGGDPDRITIFGESAGGASVHMQMLSPGSKGLFKRVIAQSGTSVCPWAMTQNHRSYALELGKKFDCYIEEGSESFLECLQSADVEGLLRHMLDTLAWGLEPLFVLPRVDGDIIPERPEILLRDGKYHKVDYMSGITRDEGSYVALMMLENPTMFDKLSENFGIFGPLSMHYMFESHARSISKKIYQHYFKRDKLKFSLSDSEIFLRLLGDRYFGMCNDIAAAIHAGDEDMSVYLYQLTHEGQMSFTDVYPDAQDKKWISHVDDLFYLCNSGELFSKPLERKEDLKLREIMVSLWTNFAKTGNPTPPGSIFVWEKATTKNFRELRLEPNPKMQRDSRSSIRKFWLSLETKENKNLLSGKKHNFHTEDSESQTREEL